MSTAALIPVGSVAAGATVVTVVGRVSMLHNPGPQPHVHFLIPSHFHQVFIDSCIVRKWPSRRDMDRSHGMNMKMLKMMMMMLVSFRHIHNGWRPHHSLHDLGIVLMGRWSRG